MEESLPKTLTHRATTKRSIAKAVTYRILILILDFVTIYLLTGKTGVALGFMMVSNIYTSIAYFFHERLWNKIDWGRSKVT